LTTSTAIEFTWLGHSTLCCDIGDKTMLIDAWVEHNPACELANDDIDKIDAMLITHGHFDHVDDAVELATRCEPEIVVSNLEICTWLESKGVKNTSGMNVGGTQDVLGHDVTMVPAIHSSSINDGGTLVPGGVATGYVVHVADGLSFYHSGDTALFSDMQLIGEFYRPEIAFLPIGDHFTMNPRQAAWATRFLQARRVVPIHWGTFPVLKGVPDQLERELADLGVDCEVIRLEPGDTYVP
jgi:L-ascorbate metabolism protein UlaG (beta-lactamase superfamily)